MTFVSISGRWPEAILLMLPYSLSSDLSRELAVQIAILAKNA